jgi:hypothetical protein
VREAAVNGMLIPALIPPRAAAGNRRRGTPGTVRRLALAVPPEQAPALAGDVVYGLSRIDMSGRVADRAVTSALGWTDGDCLTLTGAAGVVTIRRDPHGPAVLPPRHRIVIPARLRHRCGLLPGDPVLLAARPGQDTLTAYSLAVIDQALAAHIPFPAREGEDR